MIFLSKGFVPKGVLFCFTNVILLITLSISWALTRTQTNQIKFVITHRIVYFQITRNVPWLKQIRMFTSFLNNLVNTAEVFTFLFGLSHKTGPTLRYKQIIDNKFTVFCETIIIFLQIKYQLVFSEELLVIAFPVDNFQDNRDICTRNVYCSLV